MSCITGLPSCGSSSGAERIYNEKPGGAFDCLNLTYTTANVFDPATLVIRLDGVTLDVSQYTILPNDESFALILDEDDAKALSEALSNDECLRVDYTIVSSSASSCITIL